MAATMTSPAVVVKRISLPSGLNEGMSPLAAETRTARPSGKPRTYTSSLPVWFDWYATHFPSGENVAATSLPSDCTSGRGFSSPLTGTTQMSCLVDATNCCARMYLPSGDQEFVHLSYSLRHSRRSGAPA